MSADFDNLLTSLNVDETVLKSRLEELQTKIQDTQFISSGSKESILVLKEFNKLQETLEVYAKLKDAYEQIDENKELQGDEEFKDIATEEIARLEKEIEELTNRFKSLTVKPLPHDSEKAIIEIRPGVGGKEASLFAEDLYRMYTKYCGIKNWKIEHYAMEYNDEGGITEATFLVDTDESFAQLRFEAGVHRVQRVPTTESAGRIHTSSASVVVMPQITHTDVEVKQEDLRIDVYRASGPGGQSVNTTDSAVRITHTPSGITVSCQNGKSQHKNKEMAMSILMSKLQEIEDEKRAKETGDIRSSAIKTGDRSVKIRTYNFPQGRITDHRIPQTWHNMDAVMNGDIDEIVMSVNEYMRSKKNE